MFYLCIFLIGCGAGIMLYNVIRFSLFMVELKLYAYEENLFSPWIYGTYMGLMLFFLAGYVLVGTNYLYDPGIGIFAFVTSGMIFFSAVFLLIFGSVTRRMFGTIEAKTHDIVVTLVNAMEAKDPKTQGHSVHVANLVDLFYQKLPPHLQKKLDRKQLMDAAYLHDIGKIAIPDAILNKNGPLSDLEWQKIKEHPAAGWQILDHSGYSRLGEIIYCHHERVDGNGYYHIPRDMIPLESKIIAVADTFSAISTNRSYHQHSSPERAFEILWEAAGTQLDAELVALFCAISTEELRHAAELTCAQLDCPQASEIICFDL